MNMLDSYGCEPALRPVRRALETHSAVPAPADVEIIETPWGFYFEIPRDGWDPPDTIFEIFLGFLEVDGGTFMEDQTGELEFENTEPVEDILSEIDEVFVPA